MNQPANLQERLDQAGSATRMLSTPYPAMRIFPYPPEHTNVYREQRAWKETAVLFDQSWHMDDVYISGPDTIKLLSDTAVNSFAGFGAGKAKQYLAVAPDGNVVADGLLFGLADDEVLVTGNVIAVNWLRYHAEKGGYDVRIHHDPRGADGPVPKRFYRFELEGPNAWKILERAHGGPIEPVKFFQMTDFTFGDITVSALNHTMGGVPGDDATGFELWGPEVERERFLEAILAAGAEYGLVRGGAKAYLSATVESGWIPLPIPAIYTSDELADYRRWLGPWTVENFLPITGSFRPERIEDYYVTPWDLGWERFVKFDHDFIGRAALEEVAKHPARTKVWLRWNPEDTERVLGSIVAGTDETRAKPIDIPTQMHSFDEVRIGERLVGIGTMHGHTENLGGWWSVARVDLADAVDGTEVELVWGDPDGGASNPFTAPHRQTRIRATLSTTPPQV